MRLTWVRRDLSLGRRFDVRYDAGSPDFVVHHYANQGPGKDIDIYYVFRDSRARGIEVRTEDEVERLVISWTAEIMNWPRWDVWVFKGSTCNGRPEWIDKHWFKEEAYAAARKINFGRGPYRASVQRIEWPHRSAA